MTARQFAKHRETFCLASAGSDEEFHAYLSGFDAAVAIADLAAVSVQAQGAKPLDLSDDLRGQLWQIVLKMTACDDEGCGQNNCSCMARYARILAAIELPPDPRELTVWYGKMPESNGRENWTAILRPKAGDHMHGLMDGFCFARSEYHDRVRYEADRMRWIIGELTEKPDILAYDAGLHSGYVERPDPRDEVIARLVETLDRIGRGPEDAGCFCGACVQVRSARAALAAAKAVQHD